VARYNGNVVSVAPLTGAAYATLHTAATQRCLIREIGLWTTAATASTIQLARPGNTPVASTSTLGSAIDPADAASGINVDTAWSTAPTLGAKLRTVVLPATIGAGVIWTFYDMPLVIPVSSYLVFWNSGGATASILNGYVTWDE